MKCLVSVRFSIKIRGKKDWKGSEEVEVPVEPEKYPETRSVSCTSRPALCGIDENFPCRTINPVQLDDICLLLHWDS